MHTSIRRQTLGDVLRRSAQRFPAKTAIILGIATVNAFLVAGYLMHLLSEKKLIYTVLAFTVFFVIGLFVLTIWATNGFPPGTAVH